MTYVLDLSVRGTHSPVESPGGGLETVARSQPISYCRVEELMSIMITIGRGCTRMRGCAGNGHSPGTVQDERGADVSRAEKTVRFGQDPKCVRGMMGVPRTEMWCAENLTDIRPGSVIEFPVGVWSVTGYKVMSVPDSRCVRVVTPDDHVNIGFHEILIHDLADEEWPLVTLSDLGCLRL